MDSPPASGTWVQRGWKRALIDWFPLGLILVAYLVLHALGSTLTSVAHVQPQLGFDEWVFGGTAPTVRLQRELWHPGDPHWYDYLASLVYLSHFVVIVRRRPGAVGPCVSAVPPVPRLVPHRHLRRVRDVRALSGDPAVARQPAGGHAARGAHRAGDVAPPRRRPTSPPSSARRASTRSRSARCPRCTRRGRSC